MTVDEILRDILKREGWPRFTDHAADRGGPTKGGVTLKAWRRYSGRPWATADNLKGITREQALLFYERVYVLDPNFDDLPTSRLRALVVDYAVNSGPRTAARALQQVLNDLGVRPRLRVDGRVGPKTRAALGMVSEADVYLALLIQRTRFLVRLGLSDPKTQALLASDKTLQLHNLRGWTNRLADFA